MSCACKLGWGLSVSVFLVHSSAVAGMTSYKPVMTRSMCGTGERATDGAASGLPGGASQPASHSAAAGCAGCG